MRNISAILPPASFIKAESAENKKERNNGVGSRKASISTGEKVRVPKKIRPRPHAGWTGSAVLRTAGYPAGFGALL